MTTTLANLLEGVDMEGGENFCDSVYNFLKNQGKDLNLIENSGFGVWSESDINKGLAILPFDSGSVAPVVGETLTDPITGATGKVAWLEVTGGTWGGANAAGNISLGAVTGTFQDNSDITGSVGGANILTVNGDTDIGIKNDPCNNDGTGAWTDDGANITLAFAAAEYTVTTNAATQRAWIAAATVEAGKIYKIELDIKDGTAAGADIEGYFNDGAAQYGSIKTTAAGWASVSWTFECVTATGAALVGFRIPTSLAGSNIEIRYFSCYEITPCATGADAVALDKWIKDTTVDIYREYYGTNTKDGSFYSLAFVPFAVDDWIQFPEDTTLSEWTQQFEGRPVTWGAWVNASVASHARLRIYDGTVETFSSYHTGSGAFEWLEVTAQISAPATDVNFQLRTTVVGNVDGTTIVYISQPMLVFGWSLGEGMYQPKSQEIIWVETEFSLDNWAAATITADADINLEAESDARLPKGIKAVHLRLYGVNAAASEFMHTAMDNSGASEGVWIASQVGTVPVTNSGWQRCDPNGDIHVDRAATWTGVYLKILGVQVN